MACDPQLREEIVWRGRPQVVETPPVFRAAAAVWFVVAAVATCFAFVASQGLDVPPTALLCFAAWTATLGLACLHGPRIWNERVEYIITEGHVIWRRGPLRRVIPRKSISYVRIFWSPQNPNVGDMELVRAVPTGALRRRLLLRLHGLAAPDKVWALIRGIELRSESNAGVRCVSQRLDAGEHVLWSASPNVGFRHFLPHGKRGWQNLALALFMFVATVNVSQRMFGSFGKLLAAGLADRPSVLAALILGQGLTGLLVVTVASHLFYYAVVLPARKLLSTRYLITNYRVLIQRENEELHLDRAQIVDVIGIPGGRGLNDIFLVLDGPRARALELSGAFGETDRDTRLRPILEGVADADSVGRILMRSTA